MIIHPRGGSENVNAQDQEKPVIETIWFDLSVRLMLFEHISGITRTIERLFHHVKPSPTLDVRYCVVLPAVGFAEVDQEWLNHAIYGQRVRRASKPILPVEPLPELPVPQAVVMPMAQHRRKSRFRIIPYSLRHGVRKRLKTVKHWWAEPAEAEMPHLREDEIVPIKPFMAHGRKQYPPYPMDCIKSEVTLGPTDLFLSLGGQWIMAGADQTILKKKTVHGFKQASLIYDMIPTLAPQLSPPALSESTFTNVTNRQILASDLVLTISEFSKKEILEHCAKSMFPAPPVEVIYLGSDLPDRVAHKPKQTNAVPQQPFVLTVGSIEARKNQAFLYYVWRKLILTLGKEKTPKLVLAGKLGYLAEVFFAQASRDPITKDHIVFRTDITDHEIDWLYQNCLFTVYPSMYEGWGLPVEESFVYGKLCITTTASSLPEVGGEFADYVPPDELEPLYDAIVRALDPAYRAGREATIHEKFHPHTWGQCGAQLLELLHSYYSIVPPKAERDADSAQPGSEMKLKAVS